MIDLTQYPILRYHSAGTRAERDAAREECCQRYGRSEIDTGRMYRFIREELEELVRRNQRVRMPVEDAPGEGPELFV